MTTLLLILTYLSCISSGAMLSMLLLLVAAYVIAAIWLVIHGAVYSGLLYVLVYVGAIVVLIMFVVQLTNTSLTVKNSTLNVPLVAIQNFVLVIGISLLIVVAYNLLGTHLLFNLVNFNLSNAGQTVQHNYTINSVIETLDSSAKGSSLAALASSIFNEHGYILILSVHAIVLAVIGPIKLALSDSSR